MFTVIIVISNKLWLLFNQVHSAQISFIGELLKRISRLICGVISSWNNNAHLIGYTPIAKRNLKIGIKHALK